ncbi:unnamed protein product [Urochloa humidicola]
MATAGLPPAKPAPGARLALQCILHMPCGFDRVRSLDGWSGMACSFDGLWSWGKKHSFDGDQHLGRDEPLRRQLRAANCEAGHTMYIDADLAPLHTFHCFT